MFTYYKWSDFSDWSTNSVADSSTRKVETRKVYRYQSDEMMKQDDSGEERTVSGSLDKKFAGKEATLFVYKVDEASDYTNEYVAQSKIDAEGNYNFTFKLREEPTAETGDYTITLGIEGASTSVYLGKIEAPKKEYTVNFYDYNGKQISSEKVKEGDTAPLPDEAKLEREGYTFSKWTDTNINITSDKDIYAEYKINTYNVVFVDWGANTVEVQKLEYGSQLTAPQPEQIDEGTVVEWDAIADGNTTVTSDMVVCTRYAEKKCSVVIKDFDNKVIKNETITYGQGIDLPVLDAGDDKIFLGWKDISEGENAGLTDTLIKKNVILCPVYVYQENVADPTADLKTGVYDKEQMVTLTCDTKDADIYYTLDGSNPNGYSGILYTQPIKIDDAVNLQFYACKAGMNDSVIQSRMYAVNYNGATSKWMTKEELPDDVKENMSDYNIFTEKGYIYKNTKTTTLVSEAAALESDGWSLSDEETYTDYSDWSDTSLEDDETHVALDIETKPVYTAAYQYKYSHYVYQNGTADGYSPTEIEDTECKKEETEAFDKPLSIVGFDSEDNPYYIYDGKYWYNQERITGQVQTGNKYRSRFKIATYTKWSDYSTDEPTVDETREYKETTVYQYVRHNMYLVNIYANANGIPEEKQIFVEEGNKIDLSAYQNIYGYTLDGVYTDDKYTTSWDNDTETVSNNVDLYIKYTPKKYNVVFMDQDEKEIETQQVVYKESATPPEVPQIAGYKFIGWSDSSYSSVECDIKTVASYVPEDEYATVSLDNDTLSLYKGKVADLTAIIKPANKSDTKLKWTSSDTSVADVSEDGRVTGIGAGKATITVKVLETGETATCEVSVKVNAETSLSLLKNSKLSVDNNGFLRGIKAGACKVEDVCKEFENNTIVCKNVDGKELENTESIGTGSVIQLINGTKVIDSITVVVTGDITGNGTIGNKDVSKLARMLLDKEVPSDAQILAGDVNGDGEIGTRDITMMSRVMVGKDKLN